MRICPMLPLVGFLALTMGCESTPIEEPTPDTEAEGVLDLRAAIPAPSSDGQQFLAPELTIPPLEERMWCYITTYTGPDTAVSSAGFFQSKYGHHVIFEEFVGDPASFPDGSLFDCTHEDAAFMVEVRPLLFGNTTDDSPDDELEASYLRLPEGMAVKLKGGTRLIVQMHYLNTSTRPILVQDAINLEYANPSDVDNWVSVFAHTNTGLSLPPQQGSSLSVKCSFEADVYLMNINGHMHEYGSAYAIDHTRLDGTTERIYEIPHWSPEFRDLPPTDTYEPGEYLVRKGEAFTTTCSWFNSTDHTLQFPEEMCATAGFVYPSEVPIICDEG